MVVEYILKRTHCNT